MGFSTQIFWLFVLPIPIACISWTVIFEEIFRESRKYCVDRSKNCNTLFKRKFFYLLTCEYCFSHYITVIFLFLTNFKLLIDDWKGYIIAGFSVVWIANMYMNLFALIRQSIKKEKTEIKVLEQNTSTQKPVVPTS